MPFKPSVRLSLCIVVAIAILSSVIAPSVTSYAQSDMTVYDDALSPGWQNWSWNTTLDFAHGDTLHAGSAAVAATYTAAWAGLYLHHSPNIDPAPYDTLRFWIHGGDTGGHQIGVMLADGNLNFGARVAVSTQANAWTLVEIPFSDLGSPSAISGIVWQDAGGATQPTFYLDDIALVNNDLPPTPTPEPVAGLALTVDAAAESHTISPYIYGLNFADAGLAAELNLPVNRWGGNATTRYNWQNDTSNHASDWFFENIPNSNDHPGDLPNGSASDRFIETNQSTGAKTVLTLPLIGWTPKSRGYDCGFSVNKYGAQQATDPWRPDCGNGNQPDGTPITGNDPLDTSAVITETFVQDWMAHLRVQHGSANFGGVTFFALDNEPMLWNSTHRDVHPHPVGYDELRDRTVQYAAAVKTQDPAAQTLGPVLWGWTAYFYSALDQAAGGAWWENPPDRNAHGGTALVPWYLQQMQSYEQTHGVRLLDYLDLHYYPQGGQALTTAGDANLQALRLRSTRALWDPTYTDESWINEPVYLIPRMKAWVDSHYPGTKISITEYNWGGLEHINGAVAQADILGIFGREGLDLATLWDPPDPTEPGAFAFRMYRNYDGAGSAFGERSLPATSADETKLAVYAARRTTDGAITVMVVNKATDALVSSVTVSGLSAPTLVKSYRYSAADLTRIVQLPNTVLAETLTTTFPAQSITLLELTPTANWTFCYLPIILR